MCTVKQLLLGLHAGLRHSWWPPCNCCNIFEANSHLTSRDIGSLTCLTTVSWLHLVQGILCVHNCTCVLLSDWIQLLVCFVNRCGSQAGWLWRSNRYLSKYVRNSTLSATRHDYYTYITSHWLRCWLIDNFTGLSLMRNALTGVWLRWIIILYIVLDQIDSRRLMWIP